MLFPSYFLVFIEGIYDHDVFEWIVLGGLPGQFSSQKMLLCPFSLQRDSLGKVFVESWESMGNVRTFSGWQFVDCYSSYVTYRDERLFGEPFKTPTEKNKPKQFENISQTCEVTNSRYELLRNKMYFTIQTHSVLFLNVTYFWFGLRNSLIPGC